jgi:hypothetical protein
VKCPCGLEHGDCADLKKVGWQDLCDEQGGFALVVQCTCMSTFVARVVTDASLCKTCRRLITGEMGDPKVHTTDSSGAAHILCGGCARRAGIGVQLVGIVFKTWIETGSRLALQEWRARWAQRYPLKAG